MTRNQLYEYVRGKVEANLSDACTEDYDLEEMPAECVADAIYSEASTIAFDAIADLGLANDPVARGVAMAVAQAFAQP